MLPACLVLAPHLQYPTRNGGDILIDRRYHALSGYFRFVDIVSESRVLRYQAGNLASDLDFNGHMRPKWLAALRTVLRGSHYYAERYVTSKFLRTAAPLWADTAYKVVVFSQIGVASSFSILNAQHPCADRILLIETQNNDLVWFQNLMDASANPLLRLAARSSLQWADRFLRANAARFIFVHVSAQDRAGYEQLYPAMRSIVSPPGTEIHPYEPRRSEDERIRLLFVGSLGVKMNLDALAYFRAHFYPALRERFGNVLKVAVMGSSPSRVVEELCESEGWDLFPNVSEEELRSRYAGATFSILPFPYTSGAKLKLFDTLSYGVPFLATSHVAHQLENLNGLFPCLFSDDPREWVQRVDEYGRLPSRAEYREALVAFVRKYTWEKMAERYIQMLGELMPLDQEQA